MNPENESVSRQAALLLEPLLTVPLLHTGDCSLLGLSDQGQLFVEETYETHPAAASGSPFSGDLWMAQHIVSQNGQIITTLDEDEGRTTLDTPLDHGLHLARPRRVWATMALNYAGARQRGLRAYERIDDLVQPMTIREKMALAERLALDIPAPMLLGVSESYVLAEALIVAPALYLVCRRVRIAYALPQPLHDSDNLPYDYDTRLLHVAHLYDARADSPPPLSEALDGCMGVSFARPLDCLAQADRLYVADGGAAGRSSQVHFLRMPFYDRPRSAQEQIRGKLYD